MPDADDAACLYALRRWRDESGAVLNEAREGVAVEIPRCPALVLSSELDAEVPPAAARALAVRLSADFRSIPQASHVGPLLGRDAADAASACRRLAAGTRIPGAGCLTVAYRLLRMLARVRRSPRLRDPKATVPPAGHAA